MILKRICYIIVLTVLIINITVAQEDIKREVKLYNPFKPTLTRENKMNFYPQMNDTSFMSPVFKYNIIPKAFMPEYNVRAIQAARLEPDPLSKLYKSYLNIGFGNYFTPQVELSVSSDRARDKVIGFYANHLSSFGKINLENDDEVFAGYMDNYASLYATKIFRRSVLSSSIDFEHLRRYAYGYDFNNLAPLATDKDSLKIDYILPSASLSFYSTRLDSSHLDYSIDLTYDFLMQSGEYYLHNPSLQMEYGYNFKPFFASLDLSYELMLSSDAIDNNPQHIVSLSPSISKLSSKWAFNAGVKIYTYSRDVYDLSNMSEYETKLYFYPDVKFQFEVIPSLVMFYVSLDGDFNANRASNIISVNPWLLNYDPATGLSPSSELYRLKPLNNSLRIGGGIMGSAGENTSYNFNTSYTLFEDMLFFKGDTVTGRTFTPVYDNGELLKISAEFSSRINKQISLTAKANYYNYQLEKEDYPWYKPTWEGKVSVQYNLRNKIIANAGISGSSERFGAYGPSSYTGVVSESITELPVHLSLNLGFEYRYTKILSFWTRLNNISTNRYYEFGFFPSQRFLFMAGFTYSL